MRLRALAAVLLVSLPWQAAGADMAGDAQRLMRYWYGTIWVQDFTQGDTLELDLTCDGSVERVFAWRDGVLQVENDGVSVQRLGLLQGTGVAGWHEEGRAAQG